MPIIGTLVCLLQVGMNMNCSAREIQQEIEDYLSRAGTATIQDIKNLYPEYSITNIRLAFVYLERTGKAAQKRSPEGVTCWLSLIVPAA